MKKILAMFTTAALFMTTAAACSGAGNNEYPVKIAGYTFNSRPTSVICLSDSVADILVSCGYSDVITARSDECTQEELSDIPSVGSKSSPDASKIESISPDIVFTDETVSMGFEDRIDDSSIQFLNIATAQDRNDITVLFESLSSIMEGNNTGKENGEKMASSLLITLDDLQRIIPENDIAKTACYLYNTDCDAVTDSSFCGNLFEYANVVNVCGGCSTRIDVLNAINRDDPQYIFCPIGVKDKIMSDEKFKNVSAVKEGRVYEIDRNEFERQGDSMTDVLSYIIETIYPELAGTEQSGEGSKEPSKEQSAETSEQETSKQESSKQESSKQESSKQESSKQESSKQESSKQESSKPETSEVKADNSLKITDDMAFGQGDKDNDIKKIQKRLKDLGYGDFKEGITDYFGEQTAKAFKAFQKNNGLSTDGYASPEALRLLFSADVKPAKSNNNNSDDVSKNS